MLTHSTCRFTLLSELRIGIHWGIFENWTDFCRKFLIHSVHFHHCISNGFDSSYTQCSNIHTNYNVVELIVDHECAFIIMIKN